VISSRALLRKPGITDGSHVDALAAATHCPVEHREKQDDSAARNAEL
jgi:hypothetical protein